MVPADTPVTIRATSADVLHGFLIRGSNVNTTLVPGYVSVITVRFTGKGERTMPCHEFCGAGHEGMWGRVQVMRRTAFLRRAAGQARLSYAAQ